MLNTHQIKDIIKANDLFINKKLGQNFLIDKYKRDKLIDYCQIEKTDTVLEIGPGLGAITEAILPKANRLICIEKDKGFSKILEKSFLDKDKIKIINKDILKYDLSLLGYDKIKVIGNLPYYITSSIIFHLLKYKNIIDSIFITIQREVAERITAKKSSKGYGVLSCGLQYHCDCKILEKLPKGLFFPRPDVDSSFLRLKVLKKPSVKVKDEELLFKVIKSAFNQRRKTLFNSLSKSPLMEIDKDILSKAFNLSGLDRNIRGEKLSLSEFGLLSDNLSSLH